MAVLTGVVASPHRVTILDHRKLCAASHVYTASSVVWASHDGGWYAPPWCWHRNAAVLVQGGRYGRSLLIVIRSIFNTLSAMCALALRSAAFPLNQHRGMGTRGTSSGTVRARGHRLGARNGLP